MDICLMGVPKVGKTSIAKVIFQKMNPKQTMMLQQTTKVQSFQFKIQNLHFKLYDFPGQYDIVEAPPNQQMNLSGCSAVIFVISAQSQPFNDSFQMLYKIALYMQANSNKCSYHIFLHKAQNQVVGQQFKNDMLMKTKTQITQYFTNSGIKVRSIDYYLTTIYDNSIFEAMSQVVQKVLPCSTYLSKLLNQLCSNSKIQKIYLFDLITKLYIGTNAKIIQSTRHQICSQMIDIFIDISFLYTSEKKNEQNNSKAIIKLNINDDSNILLLKCVQKYLAVVCIIKQANYDRPYLIDYNIDVFKKGMLQLLHTTSSMLKL